MSTHATVGSRRELRLEIVKSLPWAWWLAVGLAIVALSLALYPGIARA